jgi:putative transcriptional regulator
VFLGDASCLSRVSDPAPVQALKFRMFTGYSGWGPGQLESELATGAWAVETASSELLFDTSVGEIWPRLAPPALPEPSLN